MRYSVKELFYSLQGEGAHTGRAAVFCRFTGCNLWSGRERDRAQAICQFCDTDFIGTTGHGGGQFSSAHPLTEAISAVWQSAQSNCEMTNRYVICTGGEPLLQLDTVLCEALHQAGFTIAVETNGTQPIPKGVDWVCVSPKAHATLIVHKGDELKLVFPQLHATPEQFAHLDFNYFFLQPMDGLARDLNTQLAIQYCLAHPQWRLSLQTHKLLGIP